MFQPTEKLNSKSAPAPSRRTALARTRTIQRGAIISPPAIAALRGPAYLAVKAVGTFVPKLTQKAFEKYGFSSATLLTDWARIVGTELARDTVPERLKWPRGAADDTTSAGGATLVLRVDPARALDISYKERQITERINTYFGYRAVADLRIIQAPVAARPDAAPRQILRVPVEPGQPATPISTNKVQSQALAQAQSEAQSEALAQALARLEAGVLARTP